MTIGRRRRSISIHAPRTGSDTPTLDELAERVEFQSTLPARGATGDGTALPCRQAHFNPRSPHGERRVLAIRRAQGVISIHAPRTGSDPIPFCCPRPGDYFNPRSPHGERHGDWYDAWDSGADFNPRSPHGERLRKVTILSIRIIGFAQKVYHKTVLLRISLAENAVILPEKPRNPVRTSLQKAGGLRFARAIRAARPYSISSPSGA